MYNPEYVTVTFNWSNTHCCLVIGDKVTVSVTCDQSKQGIVDEMLCTITARENIPGDVILTATSKV